MKKTIIIAAVIIIASIGIYFVTSNKNASAPTPVVPEVSNPTANSNEIPASSNATVSIEGFSFNPPILTIKAGTQVTWTNNDSVSHTVTSDSGNLLDSSTLPPGQSFSFIFTGTGSVGYHCNIHRTMKGQIVVQK